VPYGSGKKKEREEGGTTENRADRNGRDADKPLALDAYEALADSYAKWAETKAHNAYYERPAMLALLPDVAGLRVLDAGCGPGVYAEWLLDHGADVVCVDASPKMVAHSRDRVGTRAEVILADLGKPLDFLEDAGFDLVISPLVIDYLADWPAVFSEFHRVLKPGGRFIASKEHPASDYTQRLVDNYFRKQLVSATWRGFGTPVEVTAWHRPLQDLINALAGAGFVIERMVEPQPIPKFREADPEDYEKLLRWPGFLCVRALKGGD
jgi:SAM-dependent methyltransferase